jgi:hypothetical protein
MPSHSPFLGRQSKQQLTNKLTICQDKTDPSKKQISEEKLHERTIRFRPSGRPRGGKSIVHRRLRQQAAGSSREKGEFGLAWLCAEGRARPYAAGGSSRRRSAEKRRHFRAFFS